MNVDISLGDNSNFWRFANVTHVIEISVILIFSNRLPHVIGISPSKKYQASISFNFSINISKRMSKMKGQSKNVLTNTPKGDSGKCNCMVGIFTAKFALMEVSKFYVKNQTQEHGMIIMLKQESDTFDKKNDLKIIIYT